MLKSVALQTVNDTRLILAEPRQTRNTMTSDSALPNIDSALQLLRDNRPLRAEEICRDHLLLNPGSIQHLRVLGHALLKQARYVEAEQQFRAALALNSEMPQLYEDLGSLLAVQEKFVAAIPFFEKAIKLEPRLPLAHRKLGEALAAIGRGEEADEQFREFFERDPHSKSIATALDHMNANRRDDAVAELSSVLKSNPNSVDAMRVMAIVLWQHDKNPQDAEAWLRRATGRAPGFMAAWLTLGPVLLELNKYPEAIECYQSAIKVEPDNPMAWAGLANAYAQAMRPEDAISAYERAFELGATAASIYMSYAHVLKTVGDQAAALHAYRTAIKLKPDFGEVYWSMANLKIFEFEEEEVAAMQTQLKDGDLSDSAQVHFRFSLGKAFEDKRDFDTAWHYYDTGNQKHRQSVRHDPLDMESRHDRIIEIFSRQFIEKNQGHGDAAPDPILIVGLPRSGSTLVEQILASHSLVEGTSELPVLSRIAGSIGRYRPDGITFPAAAQDLSLKDWRAYGQQYMESTARHRVTDRAFFTDKLPNNFPLIGLLHLILPNAKVINTRRHPLDSCLGAYKQLFGRGQNFTYDIDDLSHYYLNYLRMMNHWHAVLPGKVLDVHYEDNVTDLETQVRRILDHVGLPFEQSCVDFHQTKRAVKTASSEQVRQPIYTGALGKWQKYSQNLSVWKEDFREIIAALPQSVRDAAG